MSRQIGPSLPPGHTDSDSEDDVGPSLPQVGVSSGSIGPQLPPHLQKSDLSERRGPRLPSNIQERKDSDSDSEDNSIGPQLPSSNVIGPMPPSSSGQIVGPALPPDYHNSDDDKDDEDDEDDDFIGPTPAEMAGAGDTNNVETEFERRVAKMKQKLVEGEKPKKPKRESWMTELPSIELSSELGLGPRQFRTNNAPSITDADRESWTTVGGHTSSKSKRPADEELFPEDLAKDRKIAKEVKNFNEKVRSESLMDMHTTKLKKDESKNEAPKERVPFDRERDLNTKRFDEAQRKAILKKAAKLDSRFSHGSKQYL